MLCLRSSTAQRFVCVVGRMGAAFHLFLFVPFVHECPSNGIHGEEGMLLGLQGRALCDSGHAVHLGVAFSELMLDFISLCSS